MHAISILAALLILPATIDAVVRLILRSRSRKWSSPETGEVPSDFLMIVPSRSEHARVVPTLASIVAASHGFQVRTMLLLDGEDREAESAGRSVDAEIVVKAPAGPTKGAALAWLAREHSETIRSSDCVVLVDVGSQLAPDFFRSFRWGPGMSAAQAWLRGSGQGVGRAAAGSESSAQCFEDTGREVLGWGVRLRGTGSAFRPEALLAIAPRLETQIEDMEASLLLCMDGGRAGMLPKEVVVIDEKPERVLVSGVQRARWLAGRAELVVRHAGNLARWIMRRPLEGIAFCCELAGRPLSLGGPLRIAGCAVIMTLERPGNGLWITAIVAGATVLVDLARALEGGVTPRSAAGLVASWFVAVALAPVALFRWMRARRS